MVDSVEGMPCACLASRICETMPHHRPRVNAWNALQEARTLRYIQATTPECTRVVRLLGTFMHAGHVCLVLERLFPSLLDYLSLSATLAPYTRLVNLRSIAYQLLVSRLELCHSCKSWHTTSIGQFQTIGKTEAGFAVPA